MNTPKVGRIHTRKGILYFPSYESARDYAVRNNHPTDRIIAYEIGWAIQLRESGPYVGEHELPADFCQSTNPRFNRERWLAYIAGECGPNDGTVRK
jgi:hypothetical protein